MYHEIEDQEKHSEKYELKKIDPSLTEDECFDLISKPRQTQKTIGLYLKKIKETDELSSENETLEEKTEKKRFFITPGKKDLEELVSYNKGFWVDRPEKIAPLVYKLKEKYSVNIEKKRKRDVISLNEFQCMRRLPNKHYQKQKPNQCFFHPNSEQGLFYRPKFLELDYLKEMAKAGLLYPEEEELSESEEEIEPDDTDCLPLRKTRPSYKICDPCKEEKEKKEKKDLLIKENEEKGLKPPFKKIPSGCQCDYYGEHNKRPTVWDSPFENEIDMLRQHEMNKVLKPYKHELMNSNYEKYPPITFMTHEPGTKRTFPIYQISNL